MGYINCRLLIKTHNTKPLIINPKREDKIYKRIILVDENSLSVVKRNVGSKSFDVVQSPLWEPGWFVLDWVNITGIITKLHWGKSK